MLSDVTSIGRGSQKSNPSQMCRVGHNGQMATAASTPRPRRELARATQILLADVGRAYYLDGRSKVEIAADFSISRFQVAKLLDDALAFGVVTIRIHDPRMRSSDAADVLASALGIERVAIVDVGDGTALESAESVGIAVMDQLKDLVRPQMTIGISWSRALDLAARYLPDLPPCDIVQLAGALQLVGTGSLSRVIAQLGESPGIQTFPVYAPLVVDEPSTARDLMRQPEIAEALARADRLDLAVVAIGAWSEGQSTVWEKVSPTDRQAGTDAGAVAEVSGRLLDAAGHPVHTGLDDRTIGVRIEQLVAAPQVIAVARGAERVEAVIAAVRAGIVSCLVVDGGLASALQRHIESAPLRHDG